MVALPSRLPEKWKTRCKIFMLSSGRGDPVDKGGKASAREGIRVQHRCQTVGRKMLRHDAWMRVGGRPDILHFDR